MKRLPDTDSNAENPKDADFEEKRKTTKSLTADSCGLFCCFRVYGHQLCFLWC